MGRKLQISLLIALIAGICGSLLIYWWDSTYKNEIAEGVKIGGIEVGGLDRDDAASQLRASLITPLEKNVVVTSGKQDFKLQPDELDITADIGGMVDDALAASEDGGMLGRTWRRVSGGEVDFEVDPQIAYSRKAVDGFIGGVAENLEKDAVNASVEPTADSLQPVSSAAGYVLDDDRLHRQVSAALQSTTDRKVEAEVKKVEPEVTTDQLAQQYPTYITVDRNNFQLYLYEDLELAKTYTVALGAAGYDTPQGLYNIESKQVDPVWSVPNSDWAGDLAGQTIPPGPENPLKARWMGIYNGAGIHGTSDTGSLGSAASHGCIRMDVPDVIDLYDRVPAGTPIYIS